MNHWLARAARIHPDRPAIELAGGSEQPDGAPLSYANLLQAAGAEAERRRALTRPGEVVRQSGDGSTGFAVNLHANLLLGAATMPIDTRLSPEEQRYRLEFPADPPPETVTVMFTSGTTAAPKPVYLTRRNWEANAIGSALALGLDRDERWLCTTPLAHVSGLSILIRSTLYATTVVLHDGFDTHAVLRDLTDPARRITLISVVPTMLARLLDAGLEHPPTLRWALLGGGPIPPGLLARADAASVPVAPTYGMTETCSQFATFGHPLYGNELRFEDGPSATEGEIIVRGPSVAPNVVGVDGWLRTGDLGRLDAAGRLVIVGRRSETIVSGGENVAPAEVEAALLEHAAVADAGVFARPDPEWGERVVAAVILREGHAAAPEELQAFVAQRLARFKVPKQVEFVTELPRTTSGKLLRRSLT